MVSGGGGGGGVGPTRGREKGTLLVELVTAVCTLIYYAHTLRCLQPFAIGILIT